MSKRLPKSIELVSDIKQIEASVPLAVTNHEANHAGLPRISRLIRKGINRRTNGAARLGK